MRTTEIAKSNANWTVKFIEIENDEIVYSQTVSFYTLEDAKIAEGHFLQEYSGHITFDD